MEVDLSLDRFCRSGNAIDFNDVANLNRIHSKIPSLWPRCGSSLSESRIFVGGESPLPHR
jgi:hypothetical protein